MVSGPVKSGWVEKSSYSHECVGWWTISLIIDGLSGKRRWPRNVAEWERLCLILDKIFKDGISPPLVMIDDLSEECEDELWEDFSNRWFVSFSNCSSSWVSSSSSGCFCFCWRCLSHVPMKNQYSNKRYRRKSALF